MSILTFFQKVYQRQTSNKSVHSGDIPWEQQTSMDINSMAKINDSSVHQLMVITHQIFTVFQANKFLVHHSAFMHLSKVLECSIKNFLYTQMQWIGLIESIF